MATDVITAQPVFQLGSVGTAIQSLDPSQRSLYKAQQMALVRITNRKFTLRGVSVTLLADPVVENGMLKVSLTATRNGQAMIVSNPIYIQNPPIMVWDGTYYQEFNAEFNRTFQKKNYKEDLQGALQEVLTQIIEERNS